MFTRFLQTLTHTLPGKPILPVNTIPDDDCSRSVVNFIHSKNDGLDDPLVVNAISFDIATIDNSSVVINIPSDNASSQRQRRDGVERANKLSKEPSQQVLKGMPMGSFQKTIAIVHSSVNDNCLKGNAQTRKDASNQSIEEPVSIAAETSDIPIDNTLGKKDDALNIKTDDVEAAVERFYCPYKGCTHSRKARSDIIYHVRKNHGANIPRLSARGKYTFKSGAVEDCFNKNSRGTLENGDTIMPEEITAGSSNGGLFCPYKGCNRKFSLKTNIYKHIRDHHCSSFPLLPRRGRFIIKTSSGQTILFDENSRNLINQGETPIIIEQNVNKPFCCPYEECTKQYTARASVIHHIRSKHDFQFPLNETIHILKAS